MPVTYFEEGTPNPLGRQVRKLGGEFIVVPIPNPDAEIAIADLIYNEVSAFIIGAVPAWCYNYLWNATIQVAPTAASLAGKTFSSNPTRYSLGHICVLEKFGVVDDHVWRFLETRLPNYRAHFFEGNPDPGSFFPPVAPTPLQGITYSYTQIYSQGSFDTSTTTRANGLTMFALTNAEVVVKVSYFASLVFDAVTIGFNGDNATIGLFP